jgi:hypothetical protein
MLTPLGLCVVFLAGLVVGVIFGGFVGILAGWRAGSLHAVKSMIAHGDNLIKAARSAMASSECAN